MNKKGVGLGLAIAQQIVQKFDGHINVRSVLGEGSTFYFSLKLQSSDSTEDHLDEEENYVDRDSFFYEWEPHLHDDEDGEEEDAVVFESFQARCISDEFREPIGYGCGRKMSYLSEI